MILSSENNLFGQDDAGNTPLHLACLQGNQEEIEVLLKHKDIHLLSQKNKAGLTPFLCISDNALRHALLRKYPYLADELSNEIMIILCRIATKATEAYIASKENAYFRYGFFRAVQLIETMRITMDPWSAERPAEAMQIMITDLIKHLERIEGYYGFRHPGNLYSGSQDTILIRDIYLSERLRIVFHLEEIDLQQLDIEYLTMKRDELLKGLKGFRQVLWDIITPTIIQ